jgi:hypothetical protein
MFLLSTFDQAIRKCSVNMLKKNLRATYRIVELKSTRRLLLPLLPRLLVPVIVLLPDPLEFVFVVIGDIGTPVLPVLPLLLRPVLPILKESLVLLLIMKASRPVLLHLAPQFLLPLPEELI